MGLAGIFGVAAIFWLLMTHLGKYRRYPFSFDTCTTCIPRDEISTGELSQDLFAAKLRSVVEGKAPLVYQDANAFFRNTFPATFALEDCGSKSD